MFGFLFHFSERCSSTESATEGGAGSIALLAASPPPAPPAQPGCCHQPYKFWSQLAKKMLRVEREERKSCRMARCECDCIKSSSPESSDGAWRCSSGCWAASGGSRWLGGVEHEEKKRGFLRSCADGRRLLGGAGVPEGCWGWAGHCAGFSICLQGLPVEADFFIFLSGSKCQTGCLVLTWAAQRQKISVAMGQQCCTGEIVSFSVQSFCRKVSLPEMG